MTDILQIFSGNPLSTFIGKKIEAATRPELDSEDWSLNLEICDMINENDDDAKDAVRAIKKRLQQIEQDRNFIVTNRTLTVLETCVSNCSRRFHVLVMTKDFIQDLVKLIGPKNNPPIDLQERVLRLIERWAEAFRGHPDLSGVVTVYNDLKAKGVTFPERDPSSNVPIQTPQRSVPSTTPSNQAGGPLAASVGGLPAAQGIGTMRAAPPAGGQMMPPQPAGPVVLEGEGYNKISQDLGVVQTSVEMFNDIMRLLEKSADDSDWKLAADLNTTCRQMKDRIVDLIERVANEDLTIELLRLNDDLNNIFIKYDRLVKNREKTSKGPPQSKNTALGTSSVSTSTALAPATATATTTKVSEPENDLSLIDFNADDSSSGVPENVASKTITDPFDSSAVEAALARNSKKPTDTASLSDNLNQLNLGSKSPVSATAAKTSGLPEEISSVREQDFAEIENWLSSDAGRDMLPSTEPISIPNSEFENFIATRALAGSTAPQSSSNSSPQTTAKQPSQRQPEPSV